MKRFLIALLPLLLCVACTEKPLRIKVESFVTAYQTINTIGSVTNVITKDNISYVLSSTGLHIVEHPDIDNVNLLSSTSINGDSLCFVSEAYLAVASAGKPLKIVDVADLKHPVVVFTSTEEAKGQFVSVAADGVWLAFAAGKNGVYFYDTTNPEKPVYTSVWKDAEAIGHFSVTMDEQYAFVGLKGSEGVLTTKAIAYTASDLNTPPVEVGTYPSLANIDHPLSSAGHFPLPSIYSDSKLWFPDGAQIKYVNGPGQEEATKTYIFEGTPVNIFVHQYATVGFTGDIEGYAFFGAREKSDSASTPQIHFIFETKGEAVAGNYDGTQVVVADSDNGFTVVDVQKLIDAFNAVNPMFADVVNKYYQRFIGQF
jgi:hypothetical protein